MEEKENVPVYYCNIAQIEVNIYDFNFKFGIKKKRNEPISEEDFDLQIIMSPQHAKSLLEALNQTIKNYEENFGIINTEPVKQQNHD